MTGKNEFPTDPFGPPLRHLSAQEYEAWLRDFAWPQIAHLERNFTKHHYGKSPFSFFPADTNPSPADLEVT